MQLPIFDPESSWTAPRLGDLPSWREAKRVSVDTETYDPLLKKMGPGVRRGGYIVGVSFAIEDGPAYYLPLRHVGGGNVDEAQAFQYLRDQAANFRGALVGANLQYDLDYLAEAGVEYKSASMRDVQVAEPLLDELQFSYSLDSIATRHGLPGKNDAHMREAAGLLGIENPKAEMHKMPAKHVGAYAEQDARLPLQLIRRQERMIEENDLGRVYDLECRLLPVLVAMRRWGVRIDLSRVDRVESWALEQERGALDEVFRLTGRRLTVDDTTKPAALAPALKAAGIEVPKTPTGLPSIKRDWLLGLDNPVAVQVQRARKFNKLRTTFCKSRREHQVNGRIHPTFNQLPVEKPGHDEDINGARFGRMSCTNPNMQQEPSRDEETAKVWRSVYLPDEGGEWACLDFSQQEPRWAVHYAEVSGCRGAKEAADRYRSDPKVDCYIPIAEMAGIPRDDAKQIFLGLTYGMGGGKLCRKLHLPTQWVFSRRRQMMVEAPGPEGEALIDKFDANLPFIRELADRCMKRALKRGFVVTVGGRRCRFELAPPGSDEKYLFAYKACNRVIQGSSGDQTKMAMVLSHEAGLTPQLQVHDEMDRTIINRQQAHDMIAIMKEAVACTVPMKVDLEVGPSWGEIVK